MFSAAQFAPRKQKRSLGVCPCPGWLGPTWWLPYSTGCPVNPLGHGWQFHRAKNRV